MQWQVDQHRGSSRVERKLPIRTYVSIKHYVYRLADGTYCAWFVSLPGQFR